jgi:plastocyanin
MRRTVIMTAVSIRRPARRALAALALPVAVLLLTTACGSSKSSGAASSAGATASGAASSAGATASGAASSAGATASGATTVDVKNFAFSPMDLTVAVGTKVTWKFDDSAGHTVKSDDGTFSSPTLSNGKTFDFTFSKAGTYSYICSIHQYMHGTVTVK